MLLAVHGAMIHFGCLKSTQEARVKGPIYTLLEIRCEISIVLIMRKDLSFKSHVTHYINGFASFFYRGIVGSDPCVRILQTFVRSVDSISSLSRSTYMIELII